MTASTLTRFWDACAASFDDEPDHGLTDPRVRAAWQRRMRGWLPTAPADVLDAGCGTGSLAALAAADGHRVTGVDLAPEMIAQARGKFAAAGLPGRFAVGDAADPPTGDARFDVVLCRHLLWTLPDPHAALAAWTARLRPGGRLVLIEGRWGRQDDPVTPYVPEAAGLPWPGGVPAADLARAVAPLTPRVEPLHDDADLWGRPVHDERYALIAR
ncbi:class I SAM-dependent methyltransferase [Actinomadura flavalba]|uniref:class I SAM-dependent methyltransferase n=1 Tax=Actinomadura flavalba TaxID=1120938 RepID=UPI0004771303|nr:class I SAM-dependent methyltransferase [Actinomadura flavalba]